MVPCALDSRAGCQQGARMAAMRRSIVVIAAVVMMPNSITGQGVVVQKNLSLGLAKAIAEGTIAACKAKGFNTSAAVVDRAGQVMVILRDEQATAQTVEMARRKAFTALMFRTSTLEFQKRTTDPAFAAQR